MKRIFAPLALFAMLSAAQCAASVALLMEEPHGEFGRYNPTGHAAVYLSNICAESPTQLRVCHKGEYGSVISRYHKIDKKDWIAINLVPYLYAVDDLKDIPETANKEVVTRLRVEMWRQHLQPLAPAGSKGNPPDGEWTQLVGSSFDRTIHGFQIDTTPEQDERFIALFNDRRNVGHFNLLFHNCADFSRVVLDTYFPHAIHRNIIADLGLMTPKQAARSIVKYGTKHPELRMTAFIIPQVPGSMPRSTPIDGVTESLAKSKKYLIPLAVLTPEFAGGIVAAYLVEGRSHLPKHAPMFEIGEEDNGRLVQILLPGESAPQPSAAGSSPTL